MCREIYLSLIVDASYKLSVNVLFLVVLVIVTLLHCVDVKNCTTDKITLEYVGSLLECTVQWCTIIHVHVSRVLTAGKFKTEIKDIVLHCGDSI